MRVELGKLRSDLEGVHGINVAFKRHATSAKGRCEKAQVMAWEHEAAAAKLQRELSELYSRFEERGDQLQVATSATKARAEEVKNYQAALNRSKDKVMEDPERIAMLNIADAEKTMQLAEL